MKNIIRKIITALFSVLALTALVTPAFAPAHADGCSGVWCEVLGQDGMVDYSKLKDGGVVQQQADWMPNVPLIGPIKASYHVYYTASGNKVLMPTATTLLFMAANSSESGWNAAQTLGTSGLSGAAGSNGTSGVGLAALGQMLGYITGSNPSFLPAGSGVSNATDFFNQVFSGQTNLWSLDPGKFSDLLRSIGKDDLGDHALYTYMLLYAPDQCASTPGGCLAMSTPAPTQAPPPSDCPAPSIVLGAISAGGQETYPNHPLVVGQDPNKTGVNISAHASVAPTIYTYYTQEPVHSCEPGAVNGLYTCWTGGTGGHTVTTYTCVQHTQTFSECIASASASVTLSQTSRDWILHTLSIRYPKAYIHNPYFSVGGSGCSWSGSANALQIDDPGTWNIRISGYTSGTPVSGPRGFGISGSDFDVSLKEIVIVK